MTRYGRRLHRSHKERFWAGVCGGIAEHTSMDPGVVRAFTVVAFFLTGSTIFWIYLALIFVLPKEERGEAVSPFAEQVRYSHQGRMQGLDDLKTQYEEIGERLLRMEDVVSSKEFALKRELDRL